MIENTDIEVIKFKAKDGFGLNLLHIKNQHNVQERRTKKVPVLLIHGAGVRANIFMPPVAQSLPDMLQAAGYDVWLLNWRASIDLPPNEWTLDDAALHDHPAAVEKILNLTGAKTIKAVIHCQGSTSFMMSIVAGFLPKVSTVISNAVALHPITPWLAYLKSRIANKMIAPMYPYLNPQWGLYALNFREKLIDFYVRAIHHECKNPVCKQASFTYGSGFPTLWRHENLNQDIHEWIKGEFAHVPLTFFHQMDKCLKAGHLLATGKYPQLPKNFISHKPQTKARFVFLGGECNNCFRPQSMKKTFDFFETYAPGKHSFYELAGYGHLDVFIGKNSANDVFPLIIDELGR